MKQEPLCLSWFDSQDKEQGIEKYTKKKTDFQGKDVENIWVTFPIVSEGNYGWCLQWKEPLHFVRNLWRTVLSINQGKTRHRRKIGK